MRRTLAVATFLFAIAAFGQQQPPRRPHPHGHEQSAPRLLIQVPPTASTTGVWSTLPDGCPINPVHVALMHNGKLLIISGSGNYETNFVFTAGIFDPERNLVQTFPIATDMFCNGMAILPDGRPLVVGGTMTYDTAAAGYFSGLPTTAIFDPSTGMFTPGPAMEDGRWYPTVTILPDGRAMTVAGLGIRGFMNDGVEIYDPKTNKWSSVGPAFENVDFYPRQFVLPNGMVFEAGWNPNTQIWNPATFDWTFVANTNYEQNRDYGTAFLMPLTPANKYQAKVMILGGHTAWPPDTGGPTDTTEIIDFSVPKPQWQWGPKLNAPRVQLNATLLPNGKVLVSGGSKVNESGADAVKEALLYDPATNAFTSGGTMTFPRLYHSCAILMPDATVMSFGGNPIRGDYEGHIEVYQPPYLFQPNGAAAVRPAIVTAPATIGYGKSFTVAMRGAAPADGRVVLMRPGAVTHAFDMEQRLVELTFRTESNELTATAPANANLAPPGWYLLFVLDGKGVPSVGRFVQLR
jgi:hypothetical protein